MPDWMPWVLLGVALIGALLILLAAAGMLIAGVILERGRPRVPLKSARVVAAAGRVGVLGSLLSAAACTVAGAYAGLVGDLLTAGLFWGVSSFLLTRFAARTLAHATSILRGPVGRQEGHAILDAAARRYLHMSGLEFMTAWDAGRFKDTADQPEVSRVAMLLPFGRK